jgi:hypothetical protein
LVIDYPSANVLSRATPALQVKHRHRAKGRIAPTGGVANVPPLKMEIVKKRTELPAVGAQKSKYKFGLALVYLSSSEHGRK